MNTGPILIGSKFYARCGDCHQLVQLNKRIFGGLHICLTSCEKAQRETRQPGFHWDPRTRRRGPFWARRTETWCGVCQEIVEPLS